MEAADALDRAARATEVGLSLRVSQKENAGGAPAFCLERCACYFFGAIESAAFVAASLVAAAALSAASFVASAALAAASLVA
jgi:hypothetical protein